MNIFRDRREFVVNAEAIRRTLGDDEARKVCAKALAKFEAAQPHLENLHDIRACWDSLEFFKKEYEIEFPDRDIKAAFGRWVEEGRNKTHDAIREKILEKLSSEITPQLSRCAKALAKRLRKDAEELRKVATTIAERYGCTHASTNLESDLNAVADIFDADAARPANVSWHHSPRIALSANFSTPL